jgi:hypothetical protein
VLLALLALLACGAMAVPAAGQAAAPKTITVAANEPEVDNCWPFGSVQGGGDWRPNFAFVYQNIPAFELKPGDILAFDLGSVNDFDIQLDLALARTTVNGGDENAGPFTTVVTNTQTPSNPRGDETAGDYELGFVAQAPFSFPGGGLLIRISNPSAAFNMDATCNGSLAGAVDSADTSGFFVARRFRDADGVSPWDDGDIGPIGQFRLTLLPTSNGFSFGKLIRNKKRGTAQLPVTVPGPGTLALAGKGIKAKSARRDEFAGTSVAAAGTVKLKIKPKGKLRKKLAENHRAKSRISVTFTPGGDPAGDPKTVPKRIKLIKRAP